MNRFVNVGANGQRLGEEAQGALAVADTLTALVFVKGESKEVTWSRAVDLTGRASSDDEAVRAEALEELYEGQGAALAKLGKWRLPTIEELFMLADRSRHSPAIDTTFFPACKSDWYWSSTPAAYSPSAFAWGVSFGHGSAGWGDQGYSGFVRAVRAGQ